MSAGIEKLGLFEVIFDGNGKHGIQAMACKLKENANIGGTPSTISRFACVVVTGKFQRILVRHGVSRDLAALLIGDMKRALEYFEKHPVSKPLTAAESTGFIHG